jgi:PIN domain nuclease of toxin-antitoxin system
MNILLDTHTALWLVDRHNNFSARISALVLDNKYSCFLSMVSTWEIAIKLSIGKITIDGGIQKFLTEIEQSPISILPISQQAIKRVVTLPHIHKDPFDRLLITTAITENMTILTKDENIHKYEVSAITLP